MSLILVVDPDSRHAADVASMARKHLTAEFVTADSGFRALEVLADRVPDIVLTAPLLPRRDEHVLSDHLRALGDAAAHVQTLTIPILAGGSAAPRGVRGRFRRDRSGPPSDGCDPELFAQQVHQYLQRAHQTRRPDADECAAIEADPPSTDASCVSVEDDQAPLGDDIDLTPFLSELTEPEPPPAPPLDFARGDAVPIEEPAAIAPSLPARVVEAEIVDVPDPPRVHERPVASVLPARRADSAEDLSVRGGSAIPTQHLITLPATMDEDGSGQVRTAINVAVAVSVQVAAQTTTTKVAPKRRAKPKPVQDEWGFFDPDQCGFRALLARLDSIAETEESE